MMGVLPGHGFREILLPQPFGGRWNEVNVNMEGGSHHTFQGTRFSDFAGGFSYSSTSTTQGNMKGMRNYGKKQEVVNNRFIYWRTLNDTLELTELSMDFNMFDNQVRYVFQGSPIVGPVTIQETETSVVILVSTVTSINKFVFVHPTRVDETGQWEAGVKPSVFHQVTTNRMVMKSFSLCDHGQSAPVPLSSTCHYVSKGRPVTGGVFHTFNNSEVGESFFAYSLENGGINVYRVTRDDQMIKYDLRQANIFTRLWSGLSMLSRPQTSSPDAAIGLAFLSSKTDLLQLVTLSMNGQLTVWTCHSLETFSDWSSYHCDIVDPKFAVDNYTDSSMLLRRYDGRASSESPSLAIYIPEEGFRIYKLCKTVAVSGINAGTKSYALQLSHRIDFEEREVVDFCLTKDQLLVLLHSPEEETEWDIQSTKVDFVNNTVSPFVPAMLETLPLPDVECKPEYSEPKVFYINLIFNESPFTAPTIMQALSMFRKEEDEPFHDQEWDTLRAMAMNMIDREVGLATSGSEQEITEDEFIELTQKFWVMFYNSCVEYHIHTVKPLGLFAEHNTGLLCVVKKNRVSFLRPTELLETLYYFPDMLNSIDQIDPESVEHVTQLISVAKFLSLVQTLESVMSENCSSKIQKRLREDVTQLQDVCKDIAQYIMVTDPNSCSTDERQLPQIIEDKLKDLDSDINVIMKRTLNLLFLWDNGTQTFLGDDEPVMSVSEHMMSSRVAAQLMSRIFDQLMEHRFMIARNIIILQQLLLSFFSSNGHDEEGLHIQAENSMGAREAVGAYYALIEVTKQFILPIPAFVRERGSKISNILKLLPANQNQVIGEDLLLMNDGMLWPTKEVEGFCLSNLGSLAIRNCVIPRTDTPILSYALATGRCIWPNGLNNRPFEDFLIVSCQYSILSQYAQFMGTYFGSKQSAMKNFYLGLCNLCLFNEHKGVNHWRCINFREGVQDELFCTKVLQLPRNSDAAVSLFNSFYVRVISILQIIRWLPGVQQLAEDGLKVAETDDEATKMCALAFKCALELEDYHAAYNYILRMPGGSVGDGEKKSSLRRFVTELVKKKALDILIALDMSELFSRTSSIREQVENILFAQANLSDPLEMDGVYQMLYAYHLCRGNFHKAAATMYYRAMRIGDKSTGTDALEIQKQCYLDVVTCLSLVQPEMCRHIVKKTGIQRQPEEPILCFEPVSSSNPTGTISVPLLPTEEELVVVDILEIKKELAVLQMLSKLSDTKAVNPTDFDRRVVQAVDQLCVAHCYDDALKLTVIWGLDPSPVISYFTDACCNLVYNVLPDNGDPGKYIEHNDTSELPTTETSYTEIALKLLQNYLVKMEKPLESSLHQIVTLKLLAADIELPQWLLTSYKKRNVRQLLNCLILYGEWEKATEVALKILDAALGRGNPSEFDITVKKISSYDPIEPASLPISDINELASQLKMRMEVQPVLKECYNKLRDRTSRFCDRVIECTRERNAMYGLDRKDP